MRAETLPIEHFVNFVIQNDQRIRKIVAPWRIEPQSVEQAVVGVLREMGIYTVKHDQTEVITKAVIMQLRFSPEIREMLRRAAILDQKRERHNRPEE